MKLLPHLHTFVDLFAGAGGFGLGFKMSGHFIPVCSVEKDQWAVDTLKANNVHNIVHADITTIDEEQIRNLCPTSPDVIIGGPPCQGFSNAGRRDPLDPRNSLFRYFVKWVDVLRPKVFVMENVVGLLHQHTAEGEKVIEVIRDEFRKIGYEFEIWRLNAVDYGVPQMRERICLVGNSSGSRISPPSPTHTRKGEEGKQRAITVWEAIGDLPAIKAKEGSEYMEYDAPASTDYQRARRERSSGVYNHVAMRHTDRMVKRYRRLLQGYELNELPEELKVKKRNGNGELSESHFASNYRKIEADDVSFTIPASFYSNFIHPRIPRNITAREAARIQSFPDWYVFKGKRTQISSKLLNTLGMEKQDHLSQYNQIGNAVPPLMAQAIAERIYNYLNKKAIPLPSL